MSDDKSQRNAPDNKRIDVNDPNEVRHWSKSLGVTPEQLKEAVARVGTSAEKVRESLRK
jgi:DNA-binding protein H-NS